MAGGLGKGLKGGGELFKRTEGNPQEDGREVPGGRQKTESQMNENTKKQKDANAKFDESEDTKKHKNEVRKTVVFSDDLYDRLRSFCYHRRMKEAWAIREALDEYMKKQGF